MKQITSLARVVLSPFSCNFYLRDTLKAEEYYSSISSLIHLLSLGYNITQKVEMHILVTKSIFLMYKCNLFVDFLNQKIIFETENSEEYYYEFRNYKEAYQALNMLMHNSIYSSEDDDQYEEYRNITRQITDHLEEDQDLKSIWDSLVDLSDKHLN